jgi:copper chaperone NosL
MNAKLVLLSAFLVASASCAGRAPIPAKLDVGHEMCSSCRMVISDQRFASQIVSSQQDPYFFDDLGCLTRFLDSHSLPSDARVYVADHRTRTWVSGERAVYTASHVATAPMGSHTIAHESTGSREQDPDARDGTPVEPKEVLGKHAGGAK